MFALFCVLYILNYLRFIAMKIYNRHDNIELFKQEFDELIEQLNWDGKGYSDTLIIADLSKELNIGKKKEEVIEETRFDDNNNNNQTQPVDDSISKNNMATGTDAGPNQTPIQLQQDLAYICYYPLLLVLFKMIMVTTLVLLYNYPRLVTSLMFLYFFVWMLYLIKAKPFKSQII